MPYTIFLLLFVALPLIIIILYAFQDSSGNFSFGNFVKFFTDADAIGTFALSLEVAIENTIICILLGYPAAWILANKKLNKSAVTINTLFHFVIIVMSSVVGGILGVNKKKTKELI